jgi:hypothetical protein
MEPFKKYTIDKMFENGIWYLWVQGVPTPWAGDLEKLLGIIRRLESDDKSNRIEGNPSKLHRLHEQPTVTN